MTFINSKTGEREKPATRVVIRDTKHKINFIGSAK